jgi:hypothetical protein
MAARSFVFDSRYSWKDLYTAAILETDNQRLPELIRLAEESIAFRLISLTGRQEDEADLREIKAALESLEVLKHKRLFERQIPHPESPRRKK